jgi:hypothetical protein
MFIAALTIRIKIHPKSLLMTEWIKKMRYTYTIDCYLVIKKNETLSSVGTCKDLEDMLSERLVTRVDLCEESNKVEPIELKVKEW